MIDSGRPPSLESASEESAKAPVSLLSLLEELPMVPFSANIRSPLFSKGCVSHGDKRKKEGGMYSFLITDLHVGTDCHPVLSFDGKGSQVVPHFKADPTWAPKFYFLKPIALNSINVIG